MYKIIRDIEHPIPIAYLNDFIFCPLSIFFHRMYEGVDTVTFQRKEQILGTIAHNSIDNGTYSTRKSIFQGIEVESIEWNVFGKIDILDVQNKCLIERKRKINKIYDGMVFQCYAQYFALKEMGYEINKIIIYSLIDNKSYDICLPENNTTMLDKFAKVVFDIQTFNLNDYVQDNIEKCRNCIYELYCDRSLISD